MLSHYKQAVHQYIHHHDFYKQNNLITKILVQQKHGIK